MIAECMTFVTNSGGIQKPFLCDELTAAEAYGRKSTCGRITVVYNCFSVVGAILLAGIEIGANLIVGAGSIVRGRFEPGSLVAGNPHGPCRPWCMT